MKRLKSKKKLLLVLVTVVVILAAIFTTGFLYVKANIAEVVGILFKSTAISSMKSETQGNITYYFKSEEDFNEAMAYWYNEMITQADEIVGDYFKSIEGEPLDIVIFSNYDEMNDAIHGLLPNAGALYLDKTIYLNYETIDKYIFIHEYTHYVTDLFCIENGISFDDIPTWFIEGIAYYVQFVSGDHRHVHSSLDKVVDFREAETDKDFEQIYMDGNDIVYQSYLAIDKLIELEGKEAITRILKNSKDLDFYKAFEEEVKMSLEDFHQLLLVAQ